MHAIPKMATCMHGVARMLWALHVILQEVSSWGCSLLWHTLGALAAGLFTNSQMQYQRVGT